jgi:hypothetical protein
MGNLVELFKKIKMTSGTNAKVDLLKAFPEPEKLKTFLTKAYDPNLIYSITSTGIEIKSQGLNPDMPTELFDKIPLQQGRNGKISFIKQNLTSYTQEVVDLFLWCHLVFMFKKFLSLKLSFSPPSYPYL